MVQRLVEGVVESYEAHVSKDTRSTYDEAWKDYCEFHGALVDQGVDAVLVPQHPGDVRHLGTLAMWLQWSCRDRPVIYLDRHGNQNCRQIGLAFSTVQTRLAGVISKFAELGIPDPRLNLTFRRIVKGLGNLYNEPPKKVTALTGSMVRTMIDTTHAPDPIVARDRALVALAHAKVTATRMSTLTWNHLAVDETGWVFTGPGATVELRPLPSDPLLDPIDALAAWRRDGLGGAVNGPVFASIGRGGRIETRPDGSVKISSKQTLINRVRIAARAAGIETGTSLALPDLSDRSLAEAVMTTVVSARPIVVRDRSIMTLALSVGSRRRNLSEFTVHDADIVDEGLLLRFRRSKTDQDGTDNRIADVGRVGGRYCPVELLEAWLERYEALLDRPLLPQDPLFPRLNKADALVLDGGGNPMPLSRPAFSDIAKDRAEAAGLVGRFRSHSWRRGLATTLARRNGATLQEIAKRGGWKSLDVVAAYIEEATQFSTNISALLGLDDDDQ